MNDFKQYEINYENGTTPIGNLLIGARVKDTSWEWEFRTDKIYAGCGEVKPVTWIIVAKDHYGGLEPHVTLLAEELICKYPFDNSSNRGSDYGRNHWGDSGTDNATHGLRPWLNSTGIHSGEGFYQTFSDSFKVAVLTTTLPNKEWQKGTAYSTQDKVFIPSTTELGDTNNADTYQIGITYPYFQGAADGNREALIGGDTKWYWTRSPDSYDGHIVRYVLIAGDEFYYCYTLTGSSADFWVRPALNVKSEILVSDWSLE